MQWGHVDMLAMKGSEWRIVWCGSTVLLWMVLSDVPGCVLYEDVELFVQDYLQSNYVSCILPLLLCIQHARPRKRYALRNRP